MGLVYVSGESAKLINALKSNISSSKGTTEQLTSGSQTIISAVDGRALSGYAYTAAKGLFGEVIIPTIMKAVSAIDNIESELETYISADEIISGEGKLDEDKLNLQINTKKAMKASVEISLSLLTSMLHTTTSSVISGALKGTQSSLKQMSASYSNDIWELEEKLEKLREFSATTSSLFNNSLNELNSAMQGVSYINKAIVSVNGRYVLPKNVTKAFFDELEKSLFEKTIKELNELYSKNPLAVIEKVKNNKKLFEYIITILDSDNVPKVIENIVLDIFITQESWNQLPKDLSMKVLNSPKFALYMSNKSYELHASVYSSLLKLNDKGWDVLSPLGYVTNVLSKNSAGEALIGSSKIALKEFKKIGKVADFLKKYKVAGEALGIVGDGISVVDMAYKEYTDPNSSAYGNFSKAWYGGMSLFFMQAGPLEGAQYGGPIGAGFGTLNYIAQGGGLSDIYGLNKIPYVKDILSWISDQHTFITEKDKENWLEQQYKIYDKRHEGLMNGDYSEFKIPNSEYIPGITSNSGSPNSNPNINNDILFGK